MKILRTVNDLSDEGFRSLYADFNSPIAGVDCGSKCATLNPNGKPFCCDICHAVPAAYQSEWSYLEPRTNLWHIWRGDECGPNVSAEKERARLSSETPKEMILLACLGPSVCQREFRALSCRQFPFFPYVTSDYRFAGLAYEWEFEAKCWVISALPRVTKRYRDEFVKTHDYLFATFQSVFDNYANYSEKMRAEFIRQKRRIPLLHRNGGYYWINPKNERMTKADANSFQKFGEYGNE